MKAKRVYISGAVSGRNPHSVRLQFGICETKLREAGYKTVNPTRLCPAWLPWGLCMIADIIALRFCDAICMLPGWEQSNGANIEYFFAKQFNCELLLM